MNATATRRVLVTHCATVATADLLAEAASLYALGGERLDSADDFPRFPLGVVSVSDGEVRTALVKTTEVRTTVESAEASTLMALPFQTCGSDCGAFDLWFERESASFRRD